MARPFQMYCASFLLVVQGESLAGLEFMWDTLCEIKHLGGESMLKRTSLSVLGLGLVGVGVYRYRREIVGRALGLRPARYSVTVNCNVRVLMPDGISLAADHYIPHGRGSFPTILIRTPYGRGPSVGGSGLLNAFVAQRFAERGYHVIVQDVRGRFGSGTGFEPFVHEALDGRATMEWISRRAWFNGALGMWGPSYVGYVQWAAAAGAPPYLKALMPCITGSQIPTMGIRDRALGMDTLFRWIYELEAMDRKEGASTLALLSRFNPLTQKRILENAFQVLPLAQADQAVVGKPVQFYQDWMIHPELNDPYWQAVDHGAHLVNVQAAVHQVGGWYDIMLRETLSDYARLRSSGHTPYLTIGPWMHLDLECAWESLRQGLDWFDSILQGNHRFVRRLPVRIYVMGGGWREMKSWPPMAKNTPFFLGGSRCLLIERPGKVEKPDEYIYSPADPTPSLGGPLMSLQGGPRDNRSLEVRPDVLTFTTPPLQKDVEVIGPVQLVLFVRSSCEYTDFFGRLCDVTPNRRSINVCDGLLRVEPGLGTLQPDGSLCLEISLWATAYLFQRGHCIRLQVSSGAFPRFSRNLGTGEPQAFATHMVSAHQVIYHDAAHPSALILPVTA